MRNVDKRAKPARLSLGGAMGMSCLLGFRSWMTRLSSWCLLTTRSRSVARYWTRLITGT